MSSTIDVRELVMRGYTVLKNDTELDDLIAAAMEDFAVLQRFSDRPRETRLFHRPGEDADDFDIGLKVLDGKDGRDRKTYFHFAHDLPRRNTAWGCLPMRGLEALYARNIEDGQRILTELHERRSDLFPAWVIKAHAEAGRKSGPYNVETLRGLFYSGEASATTSEIAQMHWDRNLLTTHLVSEGGELMLEFVDGKALVLPTEPGYRIVFPGVKVLHVSRGHMHPLLHGVRAEPGVTRRAMVHFHQADVGVRVRSAKKAYYDFITKMAMAQ